MAKPKSETLLAERRQIREALGADPDESVVEVLGRVLADKDAKLARLEKHVQSLGEMVKAAQDREDQRAVDSIANGGLPLTPTAPDNPDFHRGPHPGMPVDTAIYLPRGATLPEPTAGVMTAQMGDMGEPYIRWLLINGGPDKVRQQYGYGTTISRVHLLPRDVQEAIK